MCAHYCSTLLDHLRSSLLDGCMTVYTELLEKMLHTDNADSMQNCALQLWFDVRYLISLLTSSDRPTDKVMWLVLMPSVPSGCNMWLARITMGGAASMGEPLNHIH